MKFTDLYIRRPVLASVISLFILLLGFNSLSQLSIREYPEIEIAIVTVQKFIDNFEHFTDNEATRRLVAYGPQCC